MPRGGGRRGGGAPVQGTGGAVGGRGDGRGGHSRGQGEPRVLQGSGAGRNGSGGLGGAADGGQSLGIKHQTKRRPLFIPFVVEKVRMVEVKDLGQKGQFILRRPSTINPSHNTEVFLDLDSPASLYRWNIMWKICHPNILRLEGCVKNKSQNLAGAFVEPVSGVLSRYLTSSLHLANNLEVVPSQAFQHIVRQNLDGLCELAANGVYHGNFRFQNTYYRIVGDDVVVKLAGFTQRAEQTLEDGRRLDLNDLGAELEMILNHIRSEHKTFNCLLLEDLVQRLKSITFEHLRNVREWLLSTVFFWDKKKRTRFFTYTVPKYLNDPSNETRVMRYNRCSLPWDGSPFYGLKAAMNSYRKNKFNTIYNGYNRVHRFRFVSGAYTHEEQIKDSLPSNLSVDDIIQLCDLAIFLEASIRLSVIPIQFLFNDLVVLNKTKIKIALNEHGQPIGPDATEFANFIGTLVRKHIPPKTIDWRDLDEEKKLLVWDNLQAFYEVDLAALRYVLNTSHTKWKEWKADLKKSRFDATWNDEELMTRHDDRISEADWKDLLKHWRSPEFEARSTIAKENRAKSKVPHTAGSKSHARVTQEMAEELGYAPRRDEVFIRTHTLKKGPQKGQHVPQAVTIINDLLEAAEKHPEWKEKSLKEGDLFARVCGLKEPRGRVRVLGLGPTPQDVGTPGTRGRQNTRDLVELVAQCRISSMEEKMQQLQDQVNQMKEIMLSSQGGHNLETPSSPHGSDSRQIVANRFQESSSQEDNDGEEDDGEGHIERRVVANPLSQNPSIQQDESLIGTDVLLYAWNGPESPVAKATIISVDPETVVGGEPIGPATYEVIVNVAIRRDAVLPYQYDDLRFIGDSMTRSIAWPSSKMKPYRAGSSASSWR